MSEPLEDSAEERVARELGARWGLPREAVKGTYTYQWMLLGERVKHLGRSIREALPGPLRRRLQ